MTITKSADDKLSIGRDFADCAAGKIESQGLAVIGQSVESGKTYGWKSTVPQESAYKALKLAAQSEGLTLCWFMSQSL